MGNPKRRDYIPTVADYGPLVRNLAALRGRVAEADEAAVQMCEAIGELLRRSPSVSTVMRTDIVGLLALVVEDLWELDAAAAMRVYGNMLASVRGM